MKRNSLHRLRDFARLSTDLGFNLQPLRFAWHLSSKSAGGLRRQQFRLRSLGGRAVEVRLGTSDLIVLFETFGAEYDAPPSMLDPTEVKRVWDLGSNIGLTVARYACEFPKARVTGVELDTGNAKIARGNIASLSTRCNIVEGAVWIEDGEIEYVLEPQMEHGAHLISSGTTSGQKRRAHAWSLNTLLQHDDFVDFVKMDIEGAEARVLKYNTQWTNKVGVIKVECHDPYLPKHAVKDLEALGFAAEVSQVHWASVVGHSISRPTPTLPKK